MLIHFSLQWGKKQLPREITGFQTWWTEPQGCSSFMGQSPRDPCKAGSPKQEIWKPGALSLFFIALSWDRHQGLHFSWASHQAVCWYLVPKMFFMTFGPHLKQATLSFSTPQPAGWRPAPCIWWNHQTLAALQAWGKASPGDGSSTSDLTW